MTAQIKRVIVAHRRDCESTVTVEKDNGKTAVYMLGLQPHAVEQFMRGRDTKRTQALPDPEKGEFLVSVFYR